MEFQVHPEVGGIEVARQEVVKQATAIGRLPAILLGFIWEEILMHEATHVALDTFHRDTPAWKARAKGR